MDPIEKIKKASSKMGLKQKKRFEFRLKINLWKVLIGIFLIIFFLPFLLSFLQLQQTESRVDTSQALADIKEGKVKEVIVQQEKLVLTYEDDSVKVATKEENESFTDLLDKVDVDPTLVNYTVVDQSLNKAVSEVLSIVLPLGLMALFFFLIIRSQAKGAQDIFSFGRSRAKLFAKGKQSTTFKDVAGVEDEKKSWRK